MEKRRNCSLGAISPLFYDIFHLLLGFHVYAGTRFSLRDKRLFEISEVEISRVNCIINMQGLYLLVSHKFFFLYNFSCISLCKTSDPWNWAIFDHRAIM